MILPKSFARWMLLGGMTVVAAGWLGLFYFPLRRQMNELAGQWRNQREYIDQSASLMAHIEQVERKVAAAKKFCDEWQRDAPTDRSISAFYGKMHDAAQANGVVVSRFDPEAPIPLESLRKWPVQSTFVGSYPQLAKLLTSLEKTAPTMWFEECRIAPTQENGKAVQLEARMSIFADNPDISD